MLLVEDSPEDETLLLRALDQGGVALEHQRVETAEAMQAALTQREWDFVICDYSLPTFNAMAALAVLKASKLDLPFIIVSGTVGEDVAVAAMRSGAHDYVMKGNLRRLPETLRREVREANLRRERRSLEAQMRQAQKMEAVGQLAGAVAHDFNNLLTVILTFSRFAHDDMPTGSRGREDLKEVLECALRAAGLTRQLLTFSRRAVFDPQTIDLNQVMASTEKLLKGLLGKDIDYGTVASAEPARVVADRGLFEQVVVNLAVNARDAMPEGGKLTVETAHAMHRGEPHVMLAVTDTGTGMGEDVKARIFEPFFTTKGEGHGTGLGLSTVLGIVKQCGGDIEVHSTLGKGTTFKVYLPRASETDTPQQVSPATPAMQQGNETVLVVEDQASVRAAVQRALTSNGYRVVEAARPRDALELAKASGFDLVLTDLSLPEMTGTELVAKLRAFHPDLAVLYMSGFAGGALTHQGLVHPGMSFLQKPFTPDALVTKVRAALDGGRT